MAKRIGNVSVATDRCKGCGLCAASCPTGSLELGSARWNRLGYHPVQFLDCECTGCGVCFYACPEPGALRVVRPQKPSRGNEASATAAGAAHGEAPK